MTLRAESESDVPSMSSAPVGNLERASDAMAAWLLERFDVATCERLCELHPDDWQAAAECAVRAARGESDARPFTTYPELRP